MTEAASRNLRLLRGRLQPRRAPAAPLRAGAAAGAAAAAARRPARAENLVGFAQYVLHVLHQRIQKWLLACW